MATDQEGGEIRNLTWARPVEGQAAAATPERARADARGAARDLRAAGVNVNLAPVGDVASSAGSVMSGRAFPGGAEQVAALTRAAVRGLPRHARRGDRQALPRPRRGDREHRRRAGQPRRARPEQLLGEDLPPFRAAIAARVPLVMASHALYPSLDPDAIASQSRYVLHRLLRQRLGFRGVVVTDSLEAQAVTERAGPGRRRRCARCARAPTSSSPPARAATCGCCARSSPRRSARRRSGKRVEESAARVLALKKRPRPAARRADPYPAHVLVRVVLLALLGVCAAAAPAAAEPVLVVGDGGAVVRDDPALPPDALTAPPPGGERGCASARGRGRLGAPTVALGASRARRARRARSRPSSATPGSRPTAARAASRGGLRGQRADELRAVVARRRVARPPPPAHLDADARGVPPAAAQRRVLAHARRSRRRRSRSASRARARPGSAARA